MPGKILAALLLAALASGQSPDDQQAIESFESHILAGEFQQLQQPLESFTAAHLQSWRAHYQLGYVYFRLHRLHPAVAQLSKSLTLNPQFADSHKILAFTLNMLGRPDLAKAELTRAIVLNPASAESYYELGRILYEEGAYLPSVRNLEAAKRLTPDAVRVYHNLGLAYSAIGENSKAVANFEEGLRRNRLGNHPSAWPLIDYATYFNRQDSFARARQLLLEAIAIDPGQDQAFDELAKACRGLGLTDEAIAALKRASAVNSRKPEYHYVLAQMYKRTGLLAEAKAELQQYEKTRSAAK